MILNFAINLFRHLTGGRSEVFLINDQSYRSQPHSHTARSTVTTAKVVDLGEAATIRCQFTEKARCDNDTEEDGPLSYHAQGAMDAENLARCLGSSGRCEHSRHGDCIRMGGTHVLHISVLRLALDF
ncbi:unnamed protein product [Zymoseptoria tritici ST99CH_3D7]|uniref:Uncharacterized protein n=1 Tax=Zymoseptoria tritici (strain ST99CH_3D7) TaxID=1276538 RepID=A0A1X7RMC1_ZYMT9|nr:unnamed protein product [Zymoseptoria tritici ST99CH_3D7]